MDRDDVISGVLSGRRVAPLLIQDGNVDGATESALIAILTQEFERGLRAGWRSPAVSFNQRPNLVPGKLFFGWGVFSKFKSTQKACQAFIECVFNKLLQVVQTHVSYSRHGDVPSRI
jgi:hypothetical protein